MRVVMTALWDAPLVAFTTSSSWMSWAVASTAAGGTM
jgi:hypothetical protein